MPYSDHCSLKAQVFVIGSKLYIGSGNTMVSAHVTSNLTSIEWHREKINVTKNFTGQGVVAGNTFFSVHSPAYELVRKIYYEEKYERRYGKRSYKRQKLLCGRKKSGVVIYWHPGLSEWYLSNEMHHMRENYGIVTDNKSIWVVGGCDPLECWESGFIEYYNIKTDTWEELQRPPSTTPSFHHVNFCFYWEGKIYVTLYKIGRIDVKEEYADGRKITTVKIYNDYEIDPRFHIYDVDSGHWTISSSRLKTKFINSMVTVLP